MCSRPAGSPGAIPVCPRSISSAGPRTSESVERRPPVCQADVDVFALAEETCRVTPRRRVPGLETVECRISCASPCGRCAHTPPPIPGDAVDLSDNTNLWGPPPAAIRTLRTLERCCPFPLSGYSAGIVEPRPRGVRWSRGRHGRGRVRFRRPHRLRNADLRATGRHNRPGLSPLSRWSRPLQGSTDCEFMQFRSRSDFDLDVDALLAPDPGLVYLCSPNNPTGSALPRATIERVLDRASGIVLLDEAYGEFSASPGFGLVAQTERLVVTRTLSKAFGLAGLRVGYAVLAPALARALETVRGPYKLNAAAAAAATAALTEGLEWVRAHAAEAVEVRRRLAPLLVSAGFRSPPVRCEFLLHPVPKRRSRLPTVCWRGDSPCACSGRCQRSRRRSKLPAGQPCESGWARGRSWSGCFQQFTTWRLHVPNCLRLRRRQPALAGQGA